MSTLRERYFGALHEERSEEQRIREEIRSRKARQAQWVTSAYMQEFKDLLETWLLAHEPKPESHERMLYTSGTRNGLLIVKRHIDALERQMKESSHEGD